MVGLKCLTMVKISVYIGNPRFRILGDHDSAIPVKLKGKKSILNRKR